MKTDLKDSRRIKKPLGERIVRNIKKYWQYYILLLPCLIYFAIFCYGPMYGAQIAFRDFSARKGIWESDWVGFKYFLRFFDSPYFGEIIWNTLRISMYAMVVGFPFPIILALALNEVRNTKLKKASQTITYAPHFISMVVFCNMLIIFLNPNYGIINSILGLFGVEPANWLNYTEYYDHIYVWSGVWQNVGWGSIIYFSALASVDPQLVEAGTLDGATRLQKIWYIYLPTIMPTIIVQLILNCGSILSVGFEKSWLLQTDLNAPVAEVISTYVYKVGLLDRQYSFSTAVGLWNSVVNMILLILVNTFARKTSETSLW